MRGSTKEGGTHVEPHPHDAEECGIELDRAIFLHRDVHFEQVPANCDVWAAAAKAQRRFHVAEQRRKGDVGDAARSCRVVPRPRLDKLVHVVTAERGLVLGEVLEVVADDRNKEVDAAIPDGVWMTFALG